MRVIIFTDSLGRPRPDLKVNSTVYEDVYGYKLKKALGSEHEVDLLYIESLDTYDAIFWSQRMVAYRKPDIVILHIGINDCAPRIFKKGSKPIIFNRHFKKISFNIGHRFIEKYRYHITKFLKRTYTSKKDFKKNLNDIVNEAKMYNRDVVYYAISIALPSEKLKRRSYNYEVNVLEYNEILKSIFKENYIEVNDLLDRDKLLIEDGIHLTPQAHSLLAEEILKKINM